VGGQREAEVSSRQHACLRVEKDLEKTTDDVTRGASRQKHDSVTANGVTANGVTANGVTANGVTANGVTANGVTANGVTANGVTTNRVATNGVTANGVTTNGVATNSVTTNGVTSVTEDGVTSSGHSSDAEFQPKKARLDADELYPVLTCCHSAHSIDSVFNVCLEVGDVDDLVKNILKANSQLPRAQVRCPSKISWEKCSASWSNFR
jgi:hypothetical protein